MTTLMRERVNHLVAQFRVLRLFFHGQHGHVFGIEHHDRLGFAIVKYRRGHCDPHGDLVIGRLQRSTDGRSLIDLRKRLMILVGDNDLF